MGDLSGLEKFRQPGPARAAALSRLKDALAAAALAGALVGFAGVAAASPTGGLRPVDPVPSLLVPAHGASEDALDRAGAIEEAKHVVDELSMEKRIDEAWKATAVVGAETRTMRVFKMWVVHFRSAADIGGHGTDLFVFLSETGEFLKFSYNGR